MRTLADLFADSYALVANFEGNDRYVRIFKRKEVVTSVLNVLEVYSTLLRRIDPTRARELARAMLSTVIPIPPENALPAAEFQQTMRVRKKNCSYVDAWGYSAARNLGIPFLTGDRAFKDIEHVEFVR